MIFDTAVSVPEPNRALKENHQYIGHRGKKQRRRAMRQRAAVIMRSRDPETVAVRERLAAIADGMPDDPYDEFYPIICETLSTAEEENRAWPEVAAGVISAFEQADV